MTAYENDGVVGEKDKPIRIPFGIEHIDANLNGGIAKTGTMTVIGGEPNTGKTRLCLNAALNMSESGFRPGIIALDDDPVLTGEIMQTFYSGIPSGELYQNGPAYRGSERVIRAVDNSARCSVRFCFPVETGIESIVAHYHALVDDGCDVVFVDYFSDIDAGPSERAGFNMALKALRRCAKERGIPLVLAAQIKVRQSTYDKKRGTFVVPELSMFDLAETAELARKARNVILVWKDGKGNMCKVDKQKHERKANMKFRLWLDEQSGRIWSEDYVDPNATTEEAQKSSVQAALDELNKIIKH